MIGSFTDLAVKLGADPSVSASAKSGFDAASTTLQEAIKAAGGATVAPLQLRRRQRLRRPADAEPGPGAPREAGAKFVEATSKPDDYFATISYENLPDYSGDIIMLDARNTYTGYQDTAIWKSLPAVKAGRVFPWKPAAPYSYLSSIAVLDGLHQGLRLARAPDARRFSDRTSTARMRLSDRDWSSSGQENRRRRTAIAA